MPELRPYQYEDFHAVLAAHQTHQCVFGRATTGSGKAVLLAALAQHYAGNGRVLVLVDVGTLVDQLAETIEWYTGQKVGIEMAEASVVGTWFDPPKIVCGTVQTQYSGGEGHERYRRLRPEEFSCVLLDEAERF